MAYKSRFGVTKIRHRKNGRDELSISWDTDGDPNTDPKHRRYPVFLYTPWMGDTKDHSHIPLRRSEAKKLRDWLNEYLNDCPPRGKRQLTPIEKAEQAYRVQQETSALNRKLRILGVSTRPATKEDYELEAQTLKSTSMKSKD